MDVMTDKMSSARETAGRAARAMDRNHNLPVMLTLRKQEWRRRCCFSVKILAKFAGELDTIRAFS